MDFAVPGYRGWCEEAPGQTQREREREITYLLAGIHLCVSLDEVEEVTGERDIWASLLMQLPLQTGPRLSKIKRMYACMGKLR